MTEHATPSIDDYPFKVVHVGGCGGTMFLLKRRPEPGDPLVSADVINPDGTAIERESPIQCHACGNFAWFLHTDLVQPR